MLSTLITHKSPLVTINIIENHVFGLNDAYDEQTAIKAITNEFKRDKIPPRPLDNQVPEVLKAIVKKYNYLVFSFQFWRERKEPEKVIKLGSDLISSSKWNFTQNEIRFENRVNIF